MYINLILLITLSGNFHCHVTMKPSSADFHLLPLPLPPSQQLFLSLHSCSSSQEADGQMSVYIKKSEFETTAMAKAQDYLKPSNLVAGVYDANVSTK